VSKANADPLVFRVDPAIKLVERSGTALACLEKTYACLIVTEATHTYHLIIQKCSDQAQL